MPDRFEQMLKKIEARRATLRITNGSGTQTSWTCAICHDMGYIVYDVPVEDPNFGKAFPCSCQAEKRKSVREERIRSLSSLGAFPDKTFETFRPTRQGLTDVQNRMLTIAAEIAWEYAQAPEGWLLLKGSYGTGKTHLAAAIANHRLTQHGENVMLITVPDLLDHLRAAFGPSSEVAHDQIFDQVRNVPLLILDDLGAESSTQWAQEKLYVLFNHRHARRLPTVITTNQDMDLIDGRIRSRLLDQSLTRTISLNVPDNRSPSAAIEELDLYDMSRYHQMTFERFEDRRGELNEDAQNSMDKLIAATQGYAQHPMGWLVLVGPPSSGKTHLAAAIAHERRKLGEQVIMTTCSELTDYLRSAIGANASKFSKRLNELKMVPLLVLDNLVIDANTSAWVRDRLHEILIYRFDQTLPTVITMYPGAENIDLRIATRIENKAHCTVPAIKLPAYKGSTGPRRAARSRRA